MMVPILLENDGVQVGDSKSCWFETVPASDECNFDATRANPVVAFPKQTKKWAEYLESEVKTAKKQGFDVMEKGFIILVKKNGRILRRATGLHPFGKLISTMGVMDGSKFGMPDDERYGS